MNYNHLDIDRFFCEVTAAKRKCEELLSSTGETFNIFTALRLEYNEEVLHSRFIAELLNPKGTHGQKALYLNAFVESLNLPGFNYESLEQTKVITEKFIGHISEDYLCGGSIDIFLIFPSNQIIVIENKINATDQRHQLYRYKAAFPNAYLLYLTKTGSDPTKISTHHFKTEEMLLDFKGNPKHKAISFHSDVINWLTRCHELSSNLHLIRDSIHQYMSIVKQVTNQIPEPRMLTDIANVIVSSEANLEGYFSVRDPKLIKSVEQILLRKFIDDTIVLANNMGLVFDESNSNRNLGKEENDTAITFYLPETPFSFSFGFDSWRQDAWIGLSFVDEHDKIDSITEKRLFSHFFEKIGAGLTFPKWYYVLYFKNLEGCDKELSQWHEGDFTVWGKVLDGTAAERIVYHFSMFKNLLLELQLINPATSSWIVLTTN